MGRSKVSIVKPSYFDRFRCLAGECPFTCCRDWKIGVDRLTKEKWETMRVGDKGKNAEAPCLATFVRPNSDSYEIRLKEDGFCPFLNNQKLCDIVCSYGESAISETCHTFPRERHIFEGRIEETLTMGCPAALDLLWAEKEFDVMSFPSDDSVDAEAISCYEDQAPAALPAAFALRLRFCKLMQDEAYTVPEALRMIFYLMLDFDEKWDEIEAAEAAEEKEDSDPDVDPKTKRLLDENFSPAFRAQLHAGIQDVDRDPYDHFMEQNELFLDLAENYRKKQIYADAIEPLAQAAEQFEDKKLRTNALALREKFEPVWKSFDRQVRLFMTEEIYSTIYLPTGNSYTMLMKLEWLGITYAALKQCAFLRWHLNGESLSEEELRQLAVVLVRMTGYSEDDIEEYLENSFESVIWEWGYMALIV